MTGKLARHKQTAAAQAASASYRPRLVARIILIMSASCCPPPSLPRTEPARACYRVLLDFDGTIAPGDPTDRLLEQFADPAWRSLEAEWQAGRLTSRECMQRQVALLRASPRALDDAIRSVEVDPGFYAFFALCRRRGVDMTIVSDGFDRVVETVLRRAGLSIRHFANKLEWCGGDRWRLALPHGRSDCRCDAANCKCAHGTWGDARCVVIGDGRSDFCMALRAGYVIAKGALAEFCGARGLAHASFRNFDDATPRLEEWLNRSQAALARHDGTDRAELSSASGREPGT